MQHAAVITMLTDFLLAVVAAACAGLLGYSIRRRRRLQASMAWWAGGFAAVAVAAIAGGLYHGVGEQAGVGLQSTLWKLMVYAVGAFNFAALMGSIVGCVSGETRFRFMSLNVAVCLIYAVWMMTHDSFHYVVYDSAFAMLGVLGLHAAYGHREPSTPWMIAAVVVSAFAAGVQVSGLGIAWLGHNDIYHLIQIAGLYLFYRGGTLLSDRGMA